MTAKLEKALNRLKSILPLKERQEDCGKQIQELHQQVLRSFYVLMVCAKLVLRHKCYAGRAGQREQDEIIGHTTGLAKVSFNQERVAALFITGEPLRLSTEN